ESPVLHAAFSPNSRWLVTACGDGMARIWDAVTGLPLAPPLRHDGEVHWAEFSPDGRRLATAGGDGAVRLWDLPTAVERPTRALGVLAHLLAGQSTGNAEGLTPLSPDEVRAAWKELAAKHPRDFAASAVQARNWLVCQVEDCEANGQWPAALFHLERLLAS